MNESILPVSPGANPSLGLSVFDSLRAEDEPWLAECYVPPADFPLMAGWRSALIFGDVGSGKTALRLALERAWGSGGDKLPSLVVHWPMTLPESRELAGTALAQEFVGQAMDVIARALLRELGNHPEKWQQAPAFARNSLTWFVQRHLRGDIAHHVAALAGQVPAAGSELLYVLARTGVPEILRPGTATHIVMAELVGALQAFGFDGVRIMVEGLEPWVAIDLRRLATDLESLLSALGFFQHPRFAYTFLLPTELQSPLWSAGSVSRRRVDTYPLQWDAAALPAMVERRIALALGTADFTLKQLGDEKRLMAWLQGCGGESPRGWLDTTRPFLVTYLAEAEKRGQREPLTKDQCLAVQQRHPPRVFMDPEKNQITVGWREVTKLQQGQKALLRYLYQHRGRLLARREVYQAYLEGTGRKLPAQEFAMDYASTLDNAILRLRQAIEPDPEHPVLVVTVKGEGFQLENAW